MSQLIVSEGRTPASQARSAQLQCPKCGTFCEVIYPWNATAEQKMNARHAVVSEHVRVCTAATGEVKRVWNVEFPRA